MTEEERISSDKSIDLFLKYWIVSGKSEIENRGDTARKYGEYLRKICGDFDRGIQMLTADQEKRQDTLDHFDECISGSKSSRKSYKAAFNAYCEFIRRWNGARKNASDKNVLSQLSSVEKPWYREYIVEDVKGWWAQYCLYRKAIGDISPHGGKWIFRGQGDDKWLLETSLGRSVYKNEITCGHGNELKAYEGKSMWMFSRDASKDMEYRGFTGLNLLSLMQHYGCKTRLLDFSLSPLVALFVAIDQHEADMGNVKGYLWAHEKRALLPEDYPSLALWAIDLNAICEKKEDESWEHGVMRDFDWGNHILDNESDWCSCGVTVVFPSICNRRISAQDGLFVMPNCLNYSFMTNLRVKLGWANECFPAQELCAPYEIRTCLTGPIVKFTFRHDRIKDLKQILADSNVTARTVYPDLIGLGKYVASALN